MVAGNSHAVTRQSPGVTQWYCGVLKSSFYGPLRRTPRRDRPRAPELRGADEPRAAGELPRLLGRQADERRPSKPHGLLRGTAAARRRIRSRCRRSRSSCATRRSRAANVFLSSGGVFSGHADFMDAWNRAALRGSSRAASNHYIGCGAAATRRADTSLQAGIGESACNRAVNVRCSADRLHGAVGITAGIQSKGGLTMSIHAQAAAQARAVAVLSLLGSAVVAVMVATSASARVAVARVRHADDPRPAAGRQDAHGEQRHLGELADDASRTSGSSATRPGATAPTIAGATQKTYTVALGDADKTLRVAGDGDERRRLGLGHVEGHGRRLVEGRPGEHRRPGDLGHRRRSARSSTPRPARGRAASRSFAYQWQRCDAQGGSCVSVAGATGGSYGVRSADTGNTLRVVVTATNLSGLDERDVSGPTQLVATNATTPAPAPRCNSAPTIKYVSLRRLGHRIYARFSRLRRRGEERHGDRARHHARPARLRPAVLGRAGAVRHARPELDADPALPPRGAASRRTLRAVDKCGKSSRTVSRSLFFHPGQL